MDLGLVDVEWADGEGGGLRKSVLEAVSRVRFESVLPVRRFTSYRGQQQGLLDLGWLRNPELPRGPALMPAAGHDHPNKTPVRRPPLKNGTTTTTELRALGWTVSARTVERMRARYRDQGVWGLVDHRKTRLSSPTGRADERVVAAVAEVLAGQLEKSTGTRGRVRHRVEALLAERHGAGVVPMPSKTTFSRLVEAVSAGTHAFGSACFPPFPSSAARGDVHPTG